MRHRQARCGFTLIELIVVVMIVGILAAYGVPQYLRTVETRRADDAVSLVNMVGTTNRMFALDHNNTFATGAFPAGGSCGAGACPPNGPYAACALVFCKYLADQDFGVKTYQVQACNGGGCGPGNGGAAATRKLPASAPYSGWGYAMTAAGVITGYGGAPTPSY